ncbi:hypothetical protein [Pseudomonas sp. XWY-1]|uniref:hypothetical protein n=1 Tax=Pseudomonas sp. XWY-1 TaxID=2069256 RepID=UPI000CF47856|nr:hypothetical protein [Pseudomonas sp. XWY-1]
MDINELSMSKITDAIDFIEFLVEEHDIDVDEDIAASILTSNDDAEKIKLLLHVQRLLVVSDLKIKTKFALTAGLTLFMSMVVYGDIDEVSDQPINKFH